jgi:hypothetical protein
MLNQLVPDMPDRLMPQGRWQELVGALYNREIYLFTFRTTREQDARVIDLINTTLRARCSSIFFMTTAPILRAG